MKKKLMFLVVAALFLSGGVFTAIQLTNKEKVSNLTLANIEAMAIAGDDDNDVVQCPGGWTECATNGTTTLFKSKKPKN